jgi:hypothetical protein
MSPRRRLATQLLFDTSTLPWTMGGGAAAAAATAMTLPAPTRGFQRFTLRAHEELRVEVPFHSSSRPPYIIRLRWTADADNDYKDRIQCTIARGRLLKDH